MADAGRVYDNGAPKMSNGAAVGILDGNSLFRSVRRSLTPLCSGKDCCLLFIFSEFGARVPPVPTHQWMKKWRQEYS
jgi:hypothetical protein